MNAASIRQLAWHLPKLADVIASVGHGLGGAMPLIDHGMGHFHDAYCNLQFGWLAARTFAKLGIPFPGVLEGSDNVIFRTYLYNCSTKYFDRDIFEAIALTMPDRTAARRIIEALVAVPNTTTEKVAYESQVRPGVVRAYEKLFFNLIDRQKDETFIASVLYPNGRIVEMLENYMKDEDLGNILRRTGYNNGTDDVRFMAGFNGVLMHKLSSDQTAKLLEARIFANGYIMARNGFINQANNAQGIYHARTLLAAAKQGGDTESSTSMFGSLNAALKMDLLRVKGIQQKEHIEEQNKQTREAEARRDADKGAAKVEKT